MELGARDIHEKQFHDAWRGYNQSEVDEFLDRVAEGLDALQRENADLRARVAELDQAVAASRDTEEMLKKTLITAQRAAEEAIANAKAHAEELVSQAQERVSEMENQSRSRIAQAETESRRKTAEIERDLNQRRRDLDDRIDKLKGTEGEIKQRLKAFLEQQLRALEVLAGEAPRGAPLVARPSSAVAGAPARAPAEAPATEGAPAPGPASRPEWGENGGEMPEAHEPDFEVPDEAEGEEQGRRGVRDLFFRNQG
jgi:cell division initiation protein